jgi:spore coat polysaccharide biosynthesis predicted glycosyltransferase SpsG
MEVNVVAGPTNPNMEMIEKELSTTLPIFRLRSAPEDMPALMAWADLVVSAAGSTVWELAFMGLPGVLLVVAQNQRGAAKKLQEKEVFSVLEFEPHWSPQDLAQFLAPLVQGEHLRLSMSQNARLLVDGLGASRVVQVMLGF